MSATLHSQTGLHSLVDLGIQILSISCSFWGNLAKSCVGVPLESFPLGIDIGEKHVVTSLQPECALAVYCMSASDSIQAAITLTYMARNSLTQ